MLPFSLFSEQGIIALEFKGHSPHASELDPDGDWTAEAGAGAADGALEGAKDPARACVLGDGVRLLKYSSYRSCSSRRNRDFYDGPQTSRDEDSKHAKDARHGGQTASFGRIDPERQRRFRVEGRVHII